MPRTPEQQDAEARRKKHVCPQCQRGFTTSGHLARHGRVHTGERNHKCPFPGCETRCSRQDNLQQHYRVHLSPRSRNISTSAARAAMGRAAMEATRGPPPALHQTPTPSPPLDPRNMQSPPSMHMPPLDSRGSLHQPLDNRPMHQPMDNRQMHQPSLESRALHQAPLESRLPLGHLIDPPMSTASYHAPSYVPRADWPATAYRRPYSPGSSASGSSAPATPTPPSFVGYIEPTSYPQARHPSPPPILPPIQYNSPRATYHAHFEQQQQPQYATYQPAPAAYDARCGWRVQEEHKPHHY